MSEQDTMRLVAEVVDKFSGPLKDLQKAMRETQREIKGGHEGAVKATREHAKHVKELREGFGKAKEVIAGSFMPALATLGITTFGVGEAIGTLAEKIKDAAEQYNKFNDTIKRGHVSAQFVQTMQNTFEEFGIGAERANDAITKMGETFDKLKRGTNSEVRDELQNAFPDMLPMIEDILQGSKDYEQAMDRIIVATKKMHLDRDKERRVYSTLHIPTELATKSLEEYIEAREKAAKRAKEHPVDMELLEGLDGAYTKLKAAQKDFWTDLTGVYGPAAISMIEKVASAIEKLGNAFKAMPKSVPEDSIIGRMGKWFGYDVGKQPQDRINEGFNALGLSKSDHQETIKEGTKTGTLEGMRQFAAEMSAGVAGGGIMNAAYHPGGGGAGGGGGGGFHNGGGYSVLPEDGGGNVPQSMKGVTGKLGTNGSNDTADYGMGVGGNLGPFDRARFAKELEAKPWLKEKIFQLAAGEDRPSKGASLLANQAVMETMMNRANVRGTSLEQQAKWYGREKGGYYAGKPSNLSAHERAMSEENLRKVLGGSDIIDLATDNSSGNLAAGERASGKFKFHKAYHGESFFSPGWAEKGFQRRYAKMREMLSQQRAADAKKEPEWGEGAADEEPAWGEGARDGARLRDHIRHRSLLKMGKQSGLLGGGDTKVTGDASVRIDLNGFPKGTRTKASASGLFKEVQLNRGRPMGMASEDA